MDQSIEIFIQQIFFYIKYLLCAKKLVNIIKSLSFPKKLYVVGLGWHLINDIREVKVNDMPKAQSLLIYSNVFFSSFSYVFF